MFSDERFTSAMKEGRGVAVLFFSPTCAYSRMLLPMWDAVYQKMHEKIPIFRVDATKRENQGDLAKYKMPNGYPGYPAIKVLFEDDNKLDVFEYEPRNWMTSMSTIVSWLQKHIDTDLILKSMDEFKNFHFQNPNFVIGLFNGEADLHNEKVFAEASHHFPDVLFAESRDA